MITLRCIQGDAGWSQGERKAVAARTLTWGVRGARKPWTCFVTAAAILQSSARLPARGNAVRHFTTSAQLGLAAIQTYSMVNQALRQSSGARRKPRKSNLGRARLHVLRGVDCARTSSVSLPRQFRNFAATNWNLHSSSHPQRSTEGPHECLRPFRPPPLVRRPPNTQPWICRWDVRSTRRVGTHRRAGGDQPPARRLPSATLVAAGRAAAEGCGAGAEGVAAAKDQGMLRVYERVGAALRARRS